MGLRYTCAAPPLRPPEPTGRDRSFVHRALVCRRVLCVAEQKAPVYALSGTRSLGGGYNPCGAACSTAPPYPDWHYGGAYPGSTSILSLYAAWVGMAVKMLELTVQRLFRFTSARLLEADIRPALVVFPASTADAVFSEYFMKDYRYAMSCVILLLIKNMASFSLCEVSQLNYNP